MSEHGLQLFAVALSLATAGAYLVGRAWLSGWYAAAGVPLLAFSWSAQDIVILGMADSQTWLIVALALGGATLYFVTLEFLSGRLQSYVRRWMPARLREWTQRRLERSKKNSGKQPHRRPAGVYIAAIIIAALLVVFAALYWLAKVFLYEVPHYRGAVAFRNSYVYATGHPPPATIPAQDSAAKEPSASDLAAWRAAGREELAQYAFVVLEVAKEGASPQVQCGWLMQEASGHILLLTRTGFDYRIVGDQGARWQLETPEQCDDRKKAKDESATDPRAAPAPAQKSGT